MEIDRCGCSFPTLKPDIAMLEKPVSSRALKGTIMVFSGEFDKAMFAFIPANVMPLRVWIS